MTPEEVMAFTRFVLLEEGPAVEAMRQWNVNIKTVRYDVNAYQIGYSVAAKKERDRFVFAGPVVGWRATGMDNISVWPPVRYAATRRETMRRARQLEPLQVSASCPEMDNLWLYTLPILTGYDGHAYESEPSLLAFYMDPATGRRTSALACQQGVYSSINGPLHATSQLYVEEVASYSAGPFGLGRARVPSIFYSKGVRFHSEAAPPNSCLAQALGAGLVRHDGEPLALDDFRAIFVEMSRCTESGSPSGATATNVSLR